MNIFDGLESLGFDGLDKTDIYQMPESTKTNPEKPKDNPMDYLYAKEFLCPVCDRKFINYITRKSKIRLVKIDTDLKPRQEPVDPNRYDVLLCSHCGYAGLQAYFNRVADRQIDILLQKIRPRYKYKEYPIPLSAEHAVERYKMALLCAVTKGVKSGEKAIICLKTAWLYRDMGDAAHEKLFLQNALTGLKEAYSAESFPIGSMDENTTAYMIGELARRIGEYAEAMKWISALIIKRDISKGLKERATDVKELIRSETKVIK